MVKWWRSLLFIPTEVQTSQSKWMELWKIGSGPFWEAPRVQRITEADRISKNVLEALGIRTALNIGSSSNLLERPKNEGLLAAGAGWMLPYCQAARTQPWPSFANSSTSTKNASWKGFLPPNLKEIEDCPVEVTRQTWSKSKEWQWSCVKSQWIAIGQSMSHANGVFWIASMWAVFFLRGVKGSLRGGGCLELLTQVVTQGFFVRLQVWRKSANLRTQVCFGKNYNPRIRKVLMTLTQPCAW